MTPKIAHLQQRNAQARLRQRYAFLNIADIQSTDGDIARRFVDSGIYRLTNPAATTFPFHQNGIVDRPLYPSPTPSRPHRYGTPDTRLACR